MTGTQGRTLLSPHPVPFCEAVEVPHIPGVERMAPEEAGRATAPGASEALQGIYGCARVLARAAGCLYSSSAAFLRCHGFLARFTGREPAAATAASVSRGRRLSGSSSWSGCPYRMPPPLATLFLLASTVLGIAEACSSRSTPKPRAPSPTARPNITFHTYACPPAYAAWYCLNGATCFTVKIGESLLYNCECADGYMGQRCEFKDLENSYLPSRRRVMLETASIASGATIAVFLVVIVCLAFYIHFKRKHKPPSDANMSSEPGTCQVDGVERRRPFSGRPPSISLVPMRHPHPIPSPECYPAPTHGQHRSRPYPMDQGPGVYMSEYGDPHHSQYPVAPFASSSMVAPWSHGMEAPHSSTVLSVPRYHLPLRGSEPRHSHRDRPPDRVPSHHPPPPPPPPHCAVEYEMRSQ